MRQENELRQNPVARSMHRADFPSTTFNMQEVGEKRGSED